MSTTINIRPTLFLFLGTSSGKIGWRIKKLFTEAYGVEIPLYKFLWIDIDPSRTAEESNWFKEDETILLRGKGVDLTEVVKHLDSFPQIKDWWPGDILPGKLGTSGGSPNQMRLAGRLLLFRTFDENTSGSGSLRIKLENACKSIQLAAKEAKTNSLSNDLFTFKVVEGTDVIMVFSPCGGTGSAISFDLAYYCRSQLSDASIYTYEVLPEVIDVGLKGSERQREKCRKNCYAWFKENNYLSEEMNWKVRYKSDDAYTEISKHPFDVLHLVDMKNNSDKRLSTQEEAYQMVAEAVFLNSAADLQAIKDQNEANLSILSDHFPTSNGRLRMYSSIALSSLIFPKNRVIEYCSKKFTANLIKNGILAEPGSGETNSAVQVLSTTLGLRDDLLIELLQKGTEIPLEYRAMINGTSEVAKAAELISTQKSKNDALFEQKLSNLNESYKIFEEQITNELEKSVVRLSCNSGIIRAIKVLETLLDNGNELSFAHFQNVVRSSMSSFNETRLLKTLNESIEKLAKVDDGIEDKLQRTVDPKGWTNRFTAAKTACVNALEDYYKQKMLSIVCTKTIDLYTKLIDFTEKTLLKNLNVIVTNTRQIMSSEETNVKKLEETSKQKREDNFNISREIEVDLQREYDKDIDIKLDLSSVISTCTPADVQDDILTYKAWVEKGMAENIGTYSKEYFRNKLVNKTALEALKWEADSKHVDVKNLIQEKLDSLLASSQPYIKYDCNTGLGEFEETDLISIGASDEEKHFIPEKYLENPLYNFISTGFKDRIDVLKIIHGIPAHMIDGMSNFKAKYLSHLASDRVETDPLHIFVGMDKNPDVFPEDDKELEAREFFLKGLIFDFIVDLDNNCYFDPNLLITKDRIKPPVNQRLGQGWENSIKELARKQEWVTQLDDGIKDEFIKKGQKQVAGLIQNRIDEFKNKIRSLKTKNTKTQEQLLAAIEYWEEWRDSLNN